MSRKRKEQIRNKANGQRALFFGTIELSKNIIFESYAAADNIFRSFQIGERKKATVIVQF